MGLFLMALGAISLSCGAESLFAVMASTAKFPLRESGLSVLQFLFLHGKDFRVAVSAFILGRVHVVLMAESDRAQIAALGFELNISSTHLLLLSVSHPERHEANDTNTNYPNFPNLFSQVFTPFQYLINRKATSESNAFI
jgi:hypothetical protein